MNVSLLGIDIGKNKFHCYDVDDKVQKCPEKSCHISTVWRGVAVFRITQKVDLFRAAK